MDLLQWLIENARGKEAEPEMLAMRILLMNFATFHTTSSVFNFGM
jgi:hypothetical protein